MPVINEDQRRKLRTLCDKSFFHFVRIAGGHVLHGADISERIHLPLCRTAQDRTIKRKLFLMPRAWRKSTTFTKWRAVWEYLQNPGIQITIASEVIKRASEFVQWCEDQVCRNELLRFIYPELQAVDSRWRQFHKWNSLQAELPREGIYSAPTWTALGALSSAQGMHTDLILLDDITGEKAMRSPIMLQRALNWFNNCQELLVNPDPKAPGASEISGVGTFWSPGDWASYVIDACPDWQVTITPCRRDDTVKDDSHVRWIQDDTQDVGETNFPGAVDKDGRQAFPTEMYVNMEADPDPVKKAIYFTQHMNQPGKATLMTSLDEKWLKYYRPRKDESGVAMLDCENDTGNIEKSVGLGDVQLYGMIDPGGFADKLVKGGSRLVVMVAGQERGALKKFVNYCWAGRFKEPGPFIDIVFKAHESFRPMLRTWRIDTTGGATYILKHLQEEARKRGIKDFHVWPLPIDPTRNSKDEGILALAEPMTNGEVYVQRIMRELIAEVKSYPNGLTKDILDMMGAMIKCGYWTRRKKTVMDKLFGFRDAPVAEVRRSSVTGY